MAGGSSGGGTGHAGAGGEADALPQPAHLRAEGDHVLVCDPFSVFAFGMFTTADVDIHVPPIVAQCDNAFTSASTLAH